MNDFSVTGWRKSSYSNSSANCVEVAIGATVRTGTVDSGRMIGVRDSKQHGSGPVLTFSAAAWRSFLARARAGDLGT